MASTNPSVLINTSYGPITVELYPDNAPITVSNFLTYVDEGFYDRTIFHRVIDNFMIQGGGLSQSLSVKTTHSPIKLESNNGLSNLTGTIAMARTNTADSATSQFFINTVDNRFLDYQSTSSPGYAVFGKVTDGLDVATAISKTSVVNASINGVTYQSFPYPYLIPIYSIDRYTLSANPVPTTHMQSTNQNGVAIATYSGSRLDYGVKKNADNTITVTQIDGQHSSETLSGTQRLVFSDTKLAYDLNGNAGKSALLINAALGPQYMKADVVGTVINLFDQGLSLQKLAEMALPVMQAAVGVSDNASFVKTVYKNVVGSAPDSTALSTFQGILDRGEMSQAGLLALATTTSVNETTINLIGFSHSGLVYS